MFNNKFIDQYFIFLITCTCITSFGAFFVILLANYGLIDHHIFDLLYCMVVDSSTHLLKQMIS